MKKLEHGKYSIEYTPTRVGEYVFSVVVKNNGSPDCEALYYAYAVHTCIYSWVLPIDCNDKFGDRIIICHLQY